MKRVPVAFLVGLLTLCVGVLFLNGCPAAPGTGVTPTKKRDGGTMDASQVPTDTCGGSNEDCCPGDDCADNMGLVCKGGTCCGAPSAGCNAPDDCCQGLSCGSGGKCCAILQTSCIESNDCCPGLICNNGLCDKPSGGCDTAGAACCAGNHCAANFDCVNNVCKPCGTAGNACCGTAGTCSAGLTCGANKICGSDCGATGKACCPGAKPCNEVGVLCNGAVCGATTTTGGLNQACTPPTNACLSPYICKNGTCQNAATCNQVGQTCCANSTCNNGLVCGVDNKCAAGASCWAVQTDCATNPSKCCQGLACTTTVQPDGVDPKSTCCVSAGTSCKGDLDCCGWLFCNGGVCTRNADGESCLINDDCKNGYCNTATSTCGSGGSQMCAGQPVLGAQCFSSGNTCCDGSKCRVLSSAPTQNTCCKDPGTACAASKDCCGKMVCNASTKVCQCQAQNASCIDSTECCGTTTCNSGICTSSTPTKNPGDACTTNGECKTANGVSYSCSAVGSGGTCCTSVLQTPCGSNTECCGFYNGSDQAVCRSNTSVGGSDLKCCKQTGGTCSSPYDCCGLSSCLSNGRCS